MRRHWRVEVLEIQAMHDGRWLQLCSLKFGVEGAAGLGCNQALLWVLIQGSLQQGSRMHICSWKEGASSYAARRFETQRAGANESEARSAKQARSPGERDGAIIAWRSWNALIAVFTYDGYDIVPSSTRLAATSDLWVRIKGMHKQHRCQRWLWFGKCCIDIFSIQSPNGSLWEWVGLVKIIHFVEGCCCLYQDQLGFGFSHYSDCRGCTSLYFWVLYAVNER